ncbi:MAG: porin [Geobacter sp.]|nr:porin [Geobacter sp.]
MKRTTSVMLGTLLVGSGLWCGTAFAGPQMTFGPNDEGMLQLDYKGQFQMAVRDNGSGADQNGETMSFNFRRNRLALMGAYGDMFTLYVQTEYVDSQNLSLPFQVSENRANKEFTILDAALRFNFHDSFKVTAGKFKYNFTRENLDACETPLTLDRSLFIRANESTRDTGVAVWGNFLDGMFQYRADVMEGRTATDASAPQPQSSYRYGVRGHISLLDPEKDYGYKGTYLGKKKVLTIGGAYQYEPRVAYADTVAKTGEKNYHGYTADIFFEYPVEAIGTVTASMAYEDVDFGDAYKGANPDPVAFGLNGQKNGWYAKAGYMLPNLPLQFFGRYEKWSFANLKLNNVDAFNQKIDWYGMGANYYFRDQNLKLTFEYSKTDFAVENSESKDFNMFVTALQVIF